MLFLVKSKKLSLANERGPIKESTQQIIIRRNKNKNAKAKKQMEK